MRKPVIAGNWKMYKDVTEAVALANGIKRQVFDVENVDMIIIPPYVDLSEVSETIFSSNVDLGAQNCFWEEEGAYTGEIAPKMLKSVGCKYVVIGHSERRKYFGETDATVNKRIEAAVNGGLIPILCVGETLEEREGGKTIEVVKKQVIDGLKGFTEDFLKDLIVAYEPVWAIGTGKTATPEQAQEVHEMLRGLIEETYSSELAGNMRILYGGSVKPENVEELMKEKDIDGGLIGGASLKEDSFVDMVKKTSSIYA